MPAKKGGIRIKLLFEKEKETKNTIRYAEVSDDGVTKVGTIYIQKFAVSQEKLGNRIEVEIKPAKQ